jgi:hypothetical protein
MRMRDHEVGIVGAMASGVDVPGAEPSEDAGDEDEP